jgi:hypothetical protein
MYCYFCAMINSVLVAAHTSQGALIAAVRITRDDQLNGTVQLIYVVSRIDKNQVLEEEIPCKQ